MLDSLSQTAKAFRDTTVSRSTGEWFRSNCRNLGLPQPVGEIEEQYWREGVRVMAFGARGVPGTTLAFLEEVLAKWDTTVTVTTAAVNPQRITAVTPTFATDLVGRWVRMGNTGLLHYITAVDGAGAYIDVLSFGTSYWDGADFGDAATTAKLLPFVLAERGGGPDQGVGEPGLVEVTVFASAIGIPPTYMQPGATVPPAPASVPGDATYNSGSMDPVPNASPLIGAEPHPGPPEPYGGHVMADESEAGDQTNGPFPIYLAGGGVLDGTRDVLKACMASGIHATFRDGTV